MTPLEIVLSVVIVVQAVCWMAADYLDFTD